MKREVHHPVWTAQIGWRPGVHELVQFRWSVASPASRTLGETDVQMCLIEQLPQFLPKVEWNGEGVIVSSPKS